MTLSRDILASLALGAFALALALPTALRAADPLTTKEELSEVFRQQGSAARGAKLFTACVACHGRDGNG